ncbi:uncharacterized protein EV154DRAFT_48279 [Mucor mucedo]|uniref:uncharacterized protein n=1 Tax=Mucor mucedo TaxID=29922 RepID=UPI0022207EF1|nr:uncharacterized protein EV154DRAFT_48279 [Mucor mucedo]KAI7894950.1 hypothetical protein EV154DRAFT_48279 [Mucor mucedo]
MQITRKLRNVSIAAVSTLFGPICLPSKVIPHEKAKGKLRRHSFFFIRVYKEMHQIQLQNSSSVHLFHINKNSQVFLYSFALITKMNLKFLIDYIRNKKNPDFNEFVNSSLENIMAVSYKFQGKSPDLLFAWWRREFALELNRQNKDPHLLQK